MSATDDWRAAVERHRDTLEALAESDLDLQLVDDVRTLLEDVDGEGGEA